MRRQVLHIFRNTPAGRETLLASRYLAERLGLPLMVWIPTSRQFNLRFGVRELVVSLDKSYLRNPATAASNVRSILGADRPYRLFEPTSFKDTDLPELPTDSFIMTCPRVISEHTERVGLGHLGPGHIGPAVKAIVKHSRYPVFIPSAVCLRWRRLTVLYGGSSLGVESVRVGLDLASRCDMPLTLHTVKTKSSTIEGCEAALEEAGLLDKIREAATWDIREGESFAAGLMSIPRDALVVLGAAGHGVVHELFTTSKLKTMLSDYPGPMVVVGPACAI